MLIISNRQEPLLHTTIRKGNFDAARMLLEYGADPNKKANLVRALRSLSELPILFLTPF